MNGLQQRIKSYLLLGALLFSIGTQAHNVEDSDRVNAWVVAFFNSFNDNLTQGRMDAWMESWAPNAQRRTPMGNADGKEEIRALYQGLTERYSGLTHTIVDTVVEGRRASVELITVGVHRDSGNRVVIPNVALLTFNHEGKVALAKVYLDLKNIDRQIAAKH